MQRLRVAGVFVGAIVGAGFATGREIILFFGNGGFVAPVLTGVATGFCSSLFLYVGKILSRLEKRGALSGKGFGAAKVALLVIVELCMLLTMTTMIGGMQRLFGSDVKDRLAGFAVAALCVGLSSLGAAATARINLALVPVLFVLLCVLFFKSTKTVAPFPIDAGKCVGYMSMNLLLGGCVVIGDGEKATAKDALKIGAACAAFLGTAMLFVYCAASDYPLSDMPVYSLCAAEGLGAVGSLTVGVAILTTLSGAAKSLGDGLCRILPSRQGVTVCLLILALASYGWNFGEAVDVFYPFIAAVATAVFALSVVFAVVFALKNVSDRKKRDGETVQKPPSRAA